MLAQALREIQQGVSGWTIEDATLMDRLLTHPLQQQGGFWILTYLTNHPHPHTHLALVTHHPHPPTPTPIPTVTPLTPVILLPPFLPTRSHHHGRDVRSDRGDGESTGGEA